MNNENVTVSNDQILSGNIDNLAVSYADRITNPKTVSTPFSSIIKQIQESDDLAQKIASIRKLTTADERREAKQRLLPYFCGSLFKNGERNNSAFESTQVIIIDLDHCDEKLHELQSLVTTDNHACVSFISPSGDGLKILYLLKEEIHDEAAYRSAFQYVCGLVRDRYQVEPDANDDPARACFLSYDANLYFNPTCEPLSVAQAAAPVSVKPVKKPGHGISAQLVPQAAGNRTPTLVSVVGSWIRKGISIDDALAMALQWNKGNLPPLAEVKVKETVEDLFARYDTDTKRLPVSFSEKENCYYKKVGEKEIMVSTFILEPKELLVLDDNDCLVSDICSARGYKYPGILIETSDWHSKQKFLKAIGHQDCVFVGSENDLQALCAYVNSRVLVRKSGTKIVGLHNTTLWVAEGMNIDATGVSDQPLIVPYDKGSGAFYHKIAYSTSSDAEYSAMVQGFYENITGINEPDVILPFLGWIFAAPMKEIIRKELGAFPSILVHGGQGSGKTSTAKIFMRLLGYKNPVPGKCDMKPFPMLKALSSTNGVPQFYDEFKVADMKGDAVDSLLRYIREIYDGEMEQKGREDQSTVDYELLAPMCVMGEWNINQPAIRERTIMIRFSDAVKKQQEMQDAFKHVQSLALEGFLPRYIQFCLKQDIRSNLREARNFVEQLFEGKCVAPRILNNLAVLLLGLVLFQEFALHCGIPMPRIEPYQILKEQLKEITGTDSGAVRSSVDQLIEELGIMWQKNEKQITSTIFAHEPLVKQIPWWTEADVEGKKVIAIRFNKVFPEFKEYAQRTKYEGDLLDKESYVRLFRECDYIVKTSHPVSFEGKKQRCICIDIEKAQAAGIDLEGFGVTEVTP